MNSNNPLRRSRPVVMTAATLLAAGAAAVVAATSSNAANPTPAGYDVVFEPATVQPSSTRTSPQAEASSPGATLSPHLETLQEQAERDYQEDLALERAADEYDREHGTN
ncbi:hypothetical protein [Galactobacter valiniphilus]|uniref:hypothetical protein n=1 Tax=Galactobacter valiniphilus TaxID=2676122 RepID=UPI0011C4078E|nr:hypothetical protein [Galactobacter valiniphilus]